MEALLGIDLGTTVCKASVYRTDGVLLGESSVEYPLMTRGEGMIEQDAGEWWAVTETAVRRAVALAQVERTAVRALSISSQGISFVPVDADGEPLCHAICWLDRRAVGQAKDVLDKYPPEKFYGITGKQYVGGILANVLWLRQHQPGILEQTHKFLMAHDYLAFLLSGRAATDQSMAGGTGLYDRKRMDWSPDLLDAFDIPAEKLPEIRWAGTPLGTMVPAMAQALGLSEETLVVVGGQDQKCAALGAGIREGIATVSLGTASAVTCITSHRDAGQKLSIPVFSFAIPHKWYLEGVVGTSGASLRWYRETFFPEKSYAELDALAEQSPPGSNGVFFYPYLTGKGRADQGKLAWGAFSGLSLATRSQDVTRSVLEGIAFQIQEKLEAMEDSVGSVEELVLFGGGAKSPLWWKIIAEVTGKAITKAHTVETATLGACILASMGAGLFPDWRAASTSMIRPGEQRAPDEATSQGYESIFQEYRAYEVTRTTKPQGVQS